MFVLFASSLVNTWMSLQSNNGDRTKPTTELLGDTISHARNFSFFYPLRWPIYVFNSVVNTKFPAIHIYIYIYIMRGKNDATTYPDKPVSWIASLFRGLILLYFIIIFLYLYLYLYIIYIYIYIYLCIYIFFYYIIIIFFYYLYIYTRLYFIPLLHARMV